MTKEEQIFLKHMEDLANFAYHRHMPVSSDFLTLYEQDLFHRNFHKKDKMPPVDVTLNGGTSFSERKMIFFLPDKEVFSSYFPITVLKISPVNPRFMEDLTHRDYLGALLNLGMERGVLGDILIDEKKDAYVFCKQQMEAFLIEQIHVVKHTNMIAIPYEGELTALSPRMESMEGSVASPRLDSVIALAFHASRSSFSGLIEGGKVFVNSKLILSNSHLLKEGDIVSVRGYGKFVFHETGKITKKGRTYITLSKYC